MWQRLRHPWPCDVPNLQRQSACRFSAHGEGAHHRIRAAPVGSWGLSLLFEQGLSDGRARRSSGTAPPRRGEQRAARVDTRTTPWTASLIKQVQALGLTLREVLEVLGESSRRPSPGCRHVHALVTRYIAEVDRRIAELRDLRRTLDAYRQSCERALSTTPLPECPMLDALEGA